MEQYTPEGLKKEQYVECLIPMDWEEKLKENPVILIDQKKENNIEELKEKYPGHIVALDFYLEGIEEQGNLKDNVLQIGDILNVDHHAPMQEFERKISSTNLAIEWVKKNGSLGKDWQVVINHMDCDSVLSALIMRGILPPDEKLDEAAIAADHTGAENEIADLLQALEDKRDLAFSAKNLKAFLEKQELDPEAKDLLQKRYADRAKASEVVKNGGVAFVGGVAFISLDEKIDSVFFPALISEAKVILVFSPHKKDIGKSEVKIRLGMAAPEGLTLHKLKIEDFDPTFGSRWNAGSNNRSSGVSSSIEEYAGLLNKKLQSFELKEKNTSLA